MTYREKVLYNLGVLEIKPDHLLTLAELKQSYLRLTKLYHPDNDNPYTDSKKYFSMKDSYDYLYDHLELANEELMHIINGDPEVKEEVKEVVEDTCVNEAPKAMPQSEVKVEDRPTMLLIIISFLSPIVGVIMFFMTRKVTPKSSWLYLALGILSFALNVLFVAFMPKFPIGV